MEATLSLPQEFLEQLQSVIQSTVHEMFGQSKVESQFPEYMKIDQAAKYMNCSRSTLERKFIPAGLKVINIEGLLRISKEACNEFYEHNNY
ncbi:hypothetical protein [Lentilactobacillus otakiensis]|uniref:hypothetical protein n=1 Tax=Lentilactobacillus otakiensis TaxID=481720 RepID=UPI003D17AB0B